MATLQIDKLLETVVREGVSDLHLTTMQPPVVRLDGRMVQLETKTLDAEDMVGLMKSITPERNQQELQEVGGNGLRIRLWRQGPFPCRSLQAAWRHRDGAASDSQPVPDL